MDHHFLIKEKGKKLISSSTTTKIVVILVDFSPVGGLLCEPIGHLTKIHSQIAFSTQSSNHFVATFFILQFIVSLFDKFRSNDLSFNFSICFGIQNPSIEHILTHCEALVKCGSSPFSSLPKTQTMNVNHFCLIKYTKLYLASLPRVIRLIKHVYSTTDTKVLCQYLGAQ